MSTNLPLPPTTTTGAGAGNLFAAVDMGTNSFKLTVVRIDPSSGRFLTLHRLKQPVLLGLDTTATSSPGILSPDSLSRSIAALLTFQSHLDPLHLPRSHLRIVATSAVRESANNSEFVRSINETLACCPVEVITGAEEARLIYLGILQFLPLYGCSVLAIDIGGGSTEFSVGFEGSVVYSKSLRLGHVKLTKDFDSVGEMRAHVRNVVESSGLVEGIKGFKIDVVVGSSGTIKAIEKAVCRGYASEVGGNVVVFEEFVKREWGFSREELRCLVERLCEEEVMGLEGKVRRTGFFKGRAGFILAGAILLDEVFERLGIEEIEVSGYALGEGVITEMLGRGFEGFDLNVNARWRSVVKLASKFNNKKRMKAATSCASIAREIFEGLRNMNELRDDSDVLSVILDDMDLEYLEAASLLHNIGLYTGKKGYHKQSYRFVMNGNHLHGYSKEEIKLIALLVRHHRKKFPKGGVLDGSMKEKFRILCAIIRVSVAVQQCLTATLHIVEFTYSPEGFKLVLSNGVTRNQTSEVGQSLLYGEVNALVEKELEHFCTVFQKKMSIVVDSSIS